MSFFSTFRPFVQQYIDHAHAVMDGEVGTKLKKIIADKGFVIFDFWDNASSLLKELKLPAAGQKFRINTSKVIKEQFKAVLLPPRSYFSSSVLRLFLRICLYQSAYLT